MTTLQIPKILTQSDIDFLQNEKVKDLKKDFNKTRKIGALVTLLSLIISLFIGFPGQIKNESTIVLFQLLNGILLVYGIVIFFMPLLLKLTNFHNFYFYEYQEASPSLIHNCTAYINMPKMEEWKIYVEEVSKQGRKLTKSECDLIIKNWNSLI